MSCATSTGLHDGLAIANQRCAADPDGCWAGVDVSRIERTATEALAGTRPAREPTRTSADPAASASATTCGRTCRICRGWSSASSAASAVGKRRSRRDCTRRAIQSRSGISRGTRKVKSDASSSEGGLPVAACKSVAPSAYRSLVASTVPPSCSVGMYPKVPTSVDPNVRVPESRRALPKSTRTTSPPGRTIRLSGFTSRCRSGWRCR